MNAKLQTKKLRLLGAKQIVQGYKGGVGKVKAKTDLTYP